MLWEREIRGDGLLRVQSIAADDNRLLIAGQFTGTLDLGKVRLRGDDRLQGFVLVLGQDGQIRGICHIGGSADTVVLGLVADAQGFLLVGRLAESGFMLPLPGNETDHLSSTSFLTLNQNQLVIRFIGVAANEGEPASLELFDPNLITESLEIGGDQPGYGECHMPHICMGRPL